jgi:hypothetical protein
MFVPGRANGNGNGIAPTRRARSAPIGNGASLSPLVDPDDVLTFEFGRARRYERALSIAVVAPTSWPGEHDGHHDGDMRLPTALPLLTAAGLREVLRETDIMCYEPQEGRFVLGLTESESGAARRALERVQTLFQSRLRIELAVGVAQFPSDGVTLEDLIRAARLQAGLSRAAEVGPTPPPGHAPSTRPPRAAGAGVAESASPAIGSN